MPLEPKKQITILTLSLGLALFSVFSILNFTDPYEASWLIFSFFYVSLFILCFSGFSLLALGIKRWLWPKIFITDFYTSVRHGALIAVFLTLSVALQLSNILFWWMELSLILFFIAIEIYINLKQ